jgi:hypothetical protein
LAAGAEFHFFGCLKQPLSVLNGPAQADFLIGSEQRNPANGT